MSVYIVTIFTLFATLENIEHRIYLITCIAAGRERSKKWFKTVGVRTRWSSKNKGDSLSQRVTHYCVVEDLNMTVHVYSYE